MKLSLGFIIGLLLFLGCACIDRTQVISGPQKVKASKIFQLGLDSASFQSMAVFGNDLVIPERNANRLTCVDLVSLQVKWRTTLPAPPNSNAVLVGGNYYLAPTNDNFFMAVDTSGNWIGKIKFTSLTPGIPLLREFILSSSNTAIIWEGWTTSTNTGLWKLSPGSDIVPDAADPGNYVGTPVRLWQGNDLSGSVPYAKDGRIYWGYVGKDPVFDYLPNSADQHFLCLDETTGNQIWKIDSFATSAMSEMPPVLYNGSLIMVTYSGLLGISLDGQVTKAFPGIEYSQSVAIQGNVAFGARGNTPPDNIIAMNLDTGQILWHQKYEGTIGVSPAVHNGIVYQETQDDLRLFRASDGEYLGIDSSIPGDPGQGAAHLTWGHYYDPYCK